jgi:hypothetical protein
MRSRLGRLEKELKDLSTSTHGSPSAAHELKKTHFRSSINSLKLQIAEAAAVQTTDLPAHAHWGTANSVIDPDTGACLEYRHLKLGPDAKLWIQGAANEIGRLANGVEPNIKTGTQTIHFIPISAVPAGRVITYLKIVASLKLHKDEKHRVRFTVGGDRIEYDGPVSTPTCDLTTVKILLNSVLSTPGAEFATGDIANFYLNTPMPRYEYMRIPVKDIPDIIMEQYNLHGLVHNGHVIVEIRKGMYGLPHAGLIANERLVKHLAKSGYVPAKRTPGLFKHITRPVTFALTVDDFGIKYVGREHCQHLFDCIASLYTMTTDWTGTQYCGLTLNWDYTARTVDLSLPGYIENALIKFQHPAPTRPQHAPSAWTKPNYGAPQQLTDPPDTSAPLQASEITRLQQVIGTLLYYARAIDSTMLVALGSLSSAQAKGTEATAQALTHLLNYCATHPDAVLLYHASGMILHVHSDASYLSESQARSRAGGHFFLSSPLDKPDQAPEPDATPPPHNGAIHTLCTIMSQVLSSATEAEFGALFYNGKECAMLRTTLADMGHPQPATPIQTDNSCAAGIINDTVKQRRSKAMDMRFYWIKDRTKQGHFLIHWRRGADNLGDYHTKHHSPAHHQLMRPQYLLELHRQSNEDSS